MTTWPDCHASHLRKGKGNDDYIGLPDDGIFDQIMDFTLSPINDETRKALIEAYERDPYFKGKR